MLCEYNNEIIEIIVSILSLKLMQVNIVLVVLPSSLNMGLSNTILIYPQYAASDLVLLFLSIKSSTILIVLQVPRLKYSCM